MPSSSRKRFYNTLGFRLTFWYSVIFHSEFFNSLHRVLRIRILNHAR